MSERAPSKSWSQIRKEIKKKFSKISDESLDTLNESYEALSAKLQEVYGMAKERADQEILHLKKTFDVLVDKPNQPQKRSSQAKSKMKPKPPKAQPSGVEGHHP